MMPTPSSMQIRSADVSAPMTKPSTIALARSRNTHAAARACLFGRRALAALGSLLLAAVAGGVSSAQTVQPTNLPVVVADFNHDGIQDVLVPSNNGPTATIAFGSIPYGTFSASSRVVTFPSACTGLFPDLTVNQLAVGDFNGDGLPDLFFFCGGTSTGIMLGNGDGTFATPTLLTGASSVAAAMLGDFDHNGKLDIVLIGSPSGTQPTGILFYSGMGTGSFAAPVYSAFGAHPAYLSSLPFLASAAVDVNGDGYPDLIFSTQYSDNTQSVSVFGNNQDGTFGTLSQATRLPNASIPLGTNPAVRTFSLFTGNVFGSGKPDLLIGNFGTAAPGILLFQNTSTASTYSFTAATPISYPSYGSMRVGSFTNSGFTDIAVANGTNVIVLANDGTGNFTQNYSALSANITTTLFTASDANGDGYADLYTASSLSGNLSLAVNLVSGSATATSKPFSLPLGTTALSAVWPGNINFSGVTASGSQLVNGALTSTTLTSSKNPANPGDSVMLTANVSASMQTSTLPTGTVTITDGPTTLGSGTVDSSGNLTVSTSTLSVGTHTIQAVYAGNTFFAASNSSSLSQIVAQPAAVAPTLAWAPGPVTVGTALSATQLNAVATNATGTVVPGAYVYTPPSGTVLSTVGSQVLSVTFTPNDLVTYNAASLSVPITVLPGTQTPLTANLLLNPGAELGLVDGAIPNWTAAGPGTPALDSGTFDGGINPHTGTYDFVGLNGASDSLSQTVSIVTGAVTTALIDRAGVSASLSFWEQGLSQGTPSDDASVTLTFLDASSATLGSVTTAEVDSHNGAWQNLTGSYPVPPGTRSITYTMNFIRHSGSDLDGFVDDNSLILTTAIAAAPTTTTLAITSGTSPVTTVAQGTPVTLTATVLAGTTLVAPGQVNFCDASAAYCTDIHLLGTAQLTPNGTATFKFTPGIGTHTYKAVFLGTSAYTPASATAALAVTGLYPSATTLVSSGSSGNYTLAATTAGSGSLAAPTGPVSFLDTTTKATLSTGTFGASTKASSFATASSPLTGSAYLDVIVADFNGDGHPDIAVTNRNANTVTLILGNGDGTFRVASTSAAGLGLAFMTSGDFNGDGKLDIAAVNGSANSVTILLGNGDGTFTTGTTLSTTYSPTGAVAADFNGDGKTDLAVVNESRTVDIFLGNGDGTFTLSSAAPSIGATAFAVVSGDLNNDGKADLVVSNFNSNTLTILLGNGDGTFAPAPTVATGTNPYQITLGDFNGDGTLDIAVPNTSDNTVLVLLGKGDGTFTPKATIGVGSGSGAVAVGDFNGDGLDDLAVANGNDDTVSLLLGNGDGSFRPAVTTSATGGPSSIAIGDFNGDGISDIATGNQNAGPAVNILLTQITQTVTATATNISPIGTGTHQIIASYPGDTNYAASTSTPNPLTAQLVPTTATLTSSLNPSPAGSAVTFTATIVPALLNGLAATGSVTFTDGTIVLGTVSLSSIGNASLATSALVPATHTIRAVYSGDTNFATSIATFSEVIQPAQGLTFSPRSLVFGNQTVGTQSAPQSVLVSNLTGVTINIADILLILGPAPSDYLQTNNCPAVFLANATCTINVTFTPHGVGLKSAGIEIDDDSNPSTQSVNFTGTGTGGILQVNPGNLKTIAGNGTAGYTGDSGLATAAELNLPAGVAVDPTGIVYIADELNNVIRKVDLAGNITTIAGTGVMGYTGDGGLATAATLKYPATVTLDTAGNLYIFDDGNNAVRKITVSTGIITTFAGTGTAGHAGDGGPATSARLNQPQGGKFDKAGNLFVPDCVGSNLRKIDTNGIITTVAGNFTAGFSGDGGPATSAQLYCPSGVDIDAAGNLYIADDLNNRIRKVDTQGIITTIAGDGTAAYNGDTISAVSAELNLPNDLALDASGNLYIADSGNNRIRKIDTTGTITTVAGGVQNAGSAGVNTPLSLTIAPSGSLYFVDSGNNAVRQFFPAGTTPFPATGIGIAATPQTLTISNIGNVPVSIASAQSFMLSVNAADFTLTGGTCLSGATLTANGGSCTLQITFTPTALGLRMLTVSIVDTALNSPQSFTISGTGTTLTPTIAWTPSPATIMYGTALGPQQLDAVATTPTGATVPGTYTYTPAAGTVLAPGTQTIRVVFTSSSPGYTSASASQNITVTQAAPALVWATPAAIAAGTALSGTQLNATATGVNGVALPGTFVYTPAAGTVLAAGTQTLSVTFTPTDTVDYTSATTTVRLTVNGLTLTSLTPNTASLGDQAKTITLTGNGFTTGSVAQINGTSIATTFVNATTLTAIVPATNFVAAGTLTVTVANPATSSRSQALPLTVTAPAPSVTLTGPTVTQPGSQPALALTVTNPYPVPLTATFTLGFASSVTPTVDDPAIQFAGGGRTFTFTVPANSTAVPAIQLQAGTVAGTITVPLTLTAGGINVTPTTVQPVTIVVPAAIPAVTTATITRSTGSFTVTIHGFSNTREVTSAAFHFVPATGAQIDTPDVTIPVATIFSGWFTSAPSVPYGSTFTYTQVFNVSDTAANIGSVQVTLTNSVGVSTTYTAQ